MDKAWSCSGAASPQVPTITIQPEPLAPAVLYEGSFAVTLNQTITLGNGANTSVNFTVRALPPMHPYMH